ncbi:MAG: hypothetical protein J6Q42_05160, partial [Clostridia bacterium]|nr:hypothetical protein [Clostridia bacterium]
MTKKLIIIISSALIGIITMLTVIFSMIAMGAIQVEQTTIVFSSANAEAVYSGDPLTAKDWEITSGELLDGHTAKVIVSGKQTTVGSSENSISATIVDANGADVTDYYKIEYQPGMLRVFHRKLQIMGNSATKSYDGTPLTCQQYTIVSGELPAGHSVIPTYPSSITNVGTVDNTISAIIKDANGNDVTANYEIVTISGALTVTKRAMSLQSATAEKIYDGTPLTNETYSILSGELVTGHIIYPTYSASITNAGTVLNDFSVVIKDALGNDVTQNYNLTLTKGSLTVTRRALQYQSETHEKMYDTLTYTPNPAQLVSGDLVANHTATISMLNTITDVGSIENTFTVSVFDASNVDVTSNYNISYHAGTLTVLPVQIIISTGSSVKAYDGTPLTNDTWEIVAGVVPGSDTLSVLMNSSITMAGTIENDIVATVQNPLGVDVTRNYAFTFVKGTLTIATAEIIIAT